MQRKNNLKNLFKMLGGISLAFVVLTVSVFAAAPTAEIDGNTITVNYDDTEAGFGTFIYVFNKGLNMGDVIDEELLDSNLVWAGISKGGTAEIELPQNTGYGVFTVVIGAKGMPADMVERSAVVLSLEPGIEEEAVGAITGATSAEDMADMLNEYNNKAYALDLSVLDGQKEFIYDAVQELEASADVADIVAIVETVAKISSIFEADEAEIAEILKDSKLALGLTDDIDKYSSVVAKSVAERIEDDSTINEIKTIAQEELALAALNGVTASNVIETIEKYNNIFNVTFSSKLEKVNEYDVEKRLAAIDFDDVDKVEDIVNEIIGNVYEETNNKPLFGGGGGGGGSTGGYAAPSTLEQPEVKEINGDEDLSLGINDIEGYEWATEAIEYLFTNNIMTGDGNGNFRPGDNLTREEFVKLVIAAIGANKIEEATTTFVDVPEDAWFKPYVETAFAKDITTGVSVEEFGVGQYITRQDAAVMLSRAATAYYMTFAKKTTLVEFADFDDVAEYAKISVDMLARANIINGYEDGTFKPNNTITRAEIAKVIYACIGQ